MSHSGLLCSEQFTKSIHRHCVVCRVCVEIQTIGYVYESLFVYFLYMNIYLCLFVCLFVLNQPDPAVFNVSINGESCSNVSDRLLCFVMEDDNVTLDCQFDSLPLGTLDVSFNGNSLQTIDNVMVVDSRILITNFDSDVNVGEYMCTATNLVQGANVSESVTTNVLLVGM